MATKVLRSLYMCANARVKGDRIYCAVGKPLGRALDGTLPLVMLMRGAPLEIAICQTCHRYRKMGDPVMPEDRGWLKHGK
jgi:hypothetical protein